MISEIASINISDHLPTFCIVDLPVRNNVRDITQIISNLIQNFTNRILKQFTGILFTLKAMT